SLGADVREIEPDVEGAEEAFRRLRAWDMAQKYADLYRERREDLSENIIWNIEAGLDLTAKDIYDAQIARTRLHNRMMDLFREIDILAAPTVPGPPVAGGWTGPREVASVPQEHYLGWMRSCWYVSATTLAAIAVPCGFADDGLP